MHRDELAGTGGLCPSPDNQVFDAEPEGHCGCCHRYLRMWLAGVIGCCVDKCLHARFVHQQRLFSCIFLSGSDQVGRLLLAEIQVTLAIAGAVIFEIRQD